MAREGNARRKRRSATSPELRQMEIADMAYDLAEDQMASGTASSQVITYFLKAASSRERLEQLRMEHEIELMEVKKQQLEGQQRVETLFADALSAFRGYQGLPPGEVVDGTFEED